MDGSVNEIVPDNGDSATMKMLKKHKEKNEVTATMVMDSMNKANLAMALFGNSLPTQSALDKVASAFKSLPASLKYGKQEAEGLAGFKVKTSNLIPPGQVWMVGDEIMEAPMAMNWDDDPYKKMKNQMVSSLASYIDKQIMGELNTKDTQTTPAKGLQYHGLDAGYKPHKHLMPEGVVSLEVFMEDTPVYDFKLPHGVGVRYHSKPSDQLLLEQYGSEEAFRRIFDRATEYGQIYTNSSEWSRDEFKNVMTKATEMMVVFKALAPIVVVGGPNTGQIIKCNLDNVMLTAPETTAEAFSLDSVHETVQSFVYRRKPLHCGWSKDMHKFTSHWHIMVHDSVPENAIGVAFDAVLDEFPHVRLLPQHLDYWIHIKKGQ